MHPTTSRADLYATLADALRAEPGVTLGAPGKIGFGSSALQVNGKIFAMLDSRGDYVVKLPAARVQSLIASGEGAPYDAGRGRPMREWVTVKSPSEEICLALAREALAFVR